MPRPDAADRDRIDGYRTPALYLLVPGLFGPWPHARQRLQELNLRLPALERLLGRARPQRTPAPPAARPGEVAGGDFESAVCALFGLRRTPDRDLPIAALTRLADGGAPDDHWWLRADPVHLRADLHQVLLFDARFLHLSADEADDLAAEINRLLDNGRDTSDGAPALQPLTPERWYLRASADPQIVTTPLPALIGRDINPHLPRGAGRQHWRKLLTEIQMLTHVSDVNSERDWDDQPQVNGVWLWGCGRLPEADSLHAPARWLFADDPLSRGLALALPAARRPRLAALPEDADACLRQSADGALVVLETLRYYVANDDLYRWADRLQRLEQRWFAPCLAALRAGRLKTLIIDPCLGHRCVVTRADLLRFWRGSRPLAQWTTADAG